MSATDARRALQVNGRLCWNPTDLSIAYPHGGTQLGFVKAHALRVRTGQHVIRSEEWGVAVDAIFAGEEWVIAVIMASWDVDAVPLFNRDTAIGATTGRPVLKNRVGTDGVRAGVLASTLAGVLYFSPDSDAHPGVLLKNAIPLREEQAQIAFNLAEQFGDPMLFLGTPPTDSDQVGEIGLREDLTL